MVNASQIKQHIINLIVESNLEDAETFINEYISNNNHDIDIHILNSYLLMEKNKLSEARQILEEIYKKFELNFEVNYALAQLNIKERNYKEYAEYLTRCKYIKPTEKNIDELLSDINVSELSQETYESILNKVKEKFADRPWIYPAKQIGGTYVGEGIDIKNYSQVVSIYDYYHAARDGVYLDTSNPGSNRLLKYETFNASRYNKFDLICKYDTVIPVMINRLGITVKIIVDDKEYTIDNLSNNRYYYYKFNKSETIKIYSDEEIFIAEPIELYADENKPKLVLNIFIDGLSQSFIDKKGLKNLMPNTYEFFSEGIIFKNCYSISDHTKATLPGVLTGLNLNEHNIITHDYHYDRIFKEKTFLEIAKENSYFVSKIYGDPTMLPLDGVTKGVDRQLYQLSCRGMAVEEVIQETIEHIESFEEKNNFMWIEIAELHDIMDGFELRLSNQAKLDIESRMYRPDKNIPSVFAKYDERMLNMYESQIRRVDRKLSNLYEYINKMYSHDEVIISLFSDHGQGFIEDSDKYLNEGRSKVPMMIKGKDIPKLESNEFIQNIDLFPAIFKKIGINSYDLKSSIIPKSVGGEIGRKYTYTEVIHKDRHYEVEINDDTHVFHLKTVSLCDISGRFKFDEYDVELINRNTKEDETEKYMEKVEKYCQIIFDKIKDRIIY